MTRNLSCSSIFNVYIADGFADDCDELIRRCTRLSTLSYEKFCDVWKEMQFAAIFHNRNSSAEIAELSEEVLQIAKRYMITHNINFEETVAGLFLVYGLLNIQPFSNFASIKFIPDDVDALNRIEMEARRTRRQDVLYILGAILIRGPCQFHVAERERGMEFSIRKYLEGVTTMDSQGVRPKGVFFRQNEELDIIKELGRLNKLYEESKAALDDSDKSLKYVDENFASELDSSLKIIIGSSVADDNEDGQDENNERASTSQDDPQSIKQRAMRSSVQPMKHLLGVQDRKRNPPKASTGPTRKSPRKKRAKLSKRKQKRYGPCRKRGRKKNVEKEIDSEEEEEDDIECVSLADTESDDDYDSDGNNDDEDDIEERPAIEVDSNFKIHSLPMLDNSNNGSHYEIEFIDHQITDDIMITEGNKKNTESNVSKDKAYKQTDKNIGKTSDIEEATSSDNHTFKKPMLNSVILKRLERRDMKKPRVQTKFQRMGMLTVANFKEK